MSSYSLEPISDTLLTDKVYERLRLQITQGVLSPGSYLRENTIAVQLGVSRTPVRAALHRLAAEGFLTVRRRRGVVVEGLTPKDVDEVMRIREVLEGLAGYFAATKIQDAELIELHRILDSTKESHKLEDLGKMAELNSEFHHVIIRASGSERIEELLRIMHGIISRYRRLAVGLSARRLALISEHTAILDCLHQRDAEAAEARCREHVGAARRSLLSLLDSQRPSSV